MKYEEIIKLLDAGYSRDEILKMGDAPEEKKPEEVKPEEVKPEEQQPDLMAGVMEEVKGMFAEMKKELTAMNILNSRQQPDETRTSEDIIANIINPTKQKNGGN